MGDLPGPVGMALGQAGHGVSQAGRLFRSGSVPIVEAARVVKQQHEARRLAGRTAGGNDEGAKIKHPLETRGNPPYPAA